MISEKIELDNFIVLKEQSTSDKPIEAKCKLDCQTIGFVFYESGNVELDISSKNKIRTYNYNSGMVASFFGNEEVGFFHKISHKKTLQSVSLFSSVNSISKLIEQEHNLFNKHFYKLLNPQDNFVEGQSYFMTHSMQNVVHNIFNSQYTGIIKKLFLESQTTELLSHYFGLISNGDEIISHINTQDMDKLYFAKELLLKKIDEPPTLSELSKQTGLNNYKLKSGFKKIFGLPVYKYLQNERLKKAQELLENRNISVREAAWFVGYESLGSFSNAYLNKFGFRPSKSKL